MRRKLTLTVTATAFVAALAFGFHATRRSAERRFGNLSACLLGDPLAESEPPSLRFRALEYARPRARTLAERPLPPDEKWPTRCEARAKAFSRAVALRWLAPRAIEPARALADELEANGRPTRLDELWRAARPVANPNVAADTEVVRPWTPVTILPQDPLVDLAKPCPAFSLKATVDPWEPDTLVLEGRPGCSVRAAADGRPLARLTLGKASIERTNRDGIDGAQSAHVLGWRLWIEDGRAHMKREDGAASIDLGAAVRFSSCNGGGVRSILLESDAPEAFDVRFVDERGISDAAPVQLAVPSLAGHGATEITHGPLSMNCREGEARVGWAWSTAIDQVIEHVITVATCAPGHCDLREARAAIPTMISMGCGYCDFEGTPQDVQSPRVIDLFDAVVLVWSTHTTERARIAPIDRLNDTRDIILWEKPEKSYDDQEVVRGRGTVALLGVSVSTPTEGHLFRLDAHGASALTPE